MDLHLLLTDMTHSVIENTEVAERVVNLSVLEARTDFGNYFSCLN